MKVQEFCPVLVSSPAQMSQLEHSNPALVLGMGLASQQGSRTLAVGVSREKWFDSSETQGINLCFKSI